jgi:hypothetical protein
MSHLMDERRCFLLMNLMAYRLMSCRFSTSLTFPCAPSPSRLTSRYCLLTTGMPLAVRWMVSPVVVRSSCQDVAASLSQHSTWIRNWWSASLAVQIPQSGLRPLLHLPRTSMPKHASVLKTARRASRHDAESVSLVPPVS